MSCSHVTALPRLAKEGRAWHRYSQRGDLPEAKRAYARNKAARFKVQLAQQRIDHERCKP